MKRRIGNQLEDRDVVGQHYYVERSTRMEEHSASRLTRESLASDWRYVPVPGARTKCEITRPRIADCIRKCTQVHLTAQRSFWNAYISIKGQLTWIFDCMVAYHWIAFQRIMCHIDHRRLWIRWFTTRLCFRWSYFSPVRNEQLAN